MGRNKKYNWTEEEDQLIKNKYHKDGSNIPDLLKKYPNYMIRIRAKYLGLSCGKWTQHELELLKSDYPSKCWNIPELLVIRSKLAILRKASSLNIKRQTMNNSWTPEMIKKYQKQYGKKYRKSHRDYWRKYMHKIRMEVLSHYSNNSLCCELKDTYPDVCGKDCIDVLLIDHEGGNARDHIPIGKNVYELLKRQGFPKGFIDKDGLFHRFRVLCHNCNHLERLRVQNEKRNALVI